MTEKSTEKKVKSSSHPSLKCEQRVQTAEGLRRRVVKQSPSKRKKTSS